MSAVLTDIDVERIADAVSKRQAVPLVSATVDDLKVMLRCSSRSATYREIETLGLKPYTRGKYRIRDVENAVARRTRS